MFKAGIDLNIIDLQKKEDYLWLQSLIWPEHEERRRIMKEAAKMLKNQSVHLVEGDGVAILDTLVQQALKIRQFAFSILMLLIKYPKSQNKN